MSKDDTLEGRAVPTSRLGRLARLGIGGLATGARMLVTGDSESAAQQALQMMGTLRGMAAKAGQIASYVDGLVPEEHRAAFEKTLGTLRAAAPTSSPKAIRARVEEELGAPIEQRFAAFEEYPFASASIGQVHRATLFDGTQVAVKVQHPGIDEAMRGDLDNASLIESMVGNLGARKIGSKQVIAEVRARFLEELDYCLEADHQEFFTNLFTGDATISIPRIVRSHSARRVLTSVLHHGADLDTAAKAPEALRRSYAETLWRFVFGGNLVGGRFNADPHPGNYLFNDDGVITFLDFGCVQPLDPTHLGYARKLHRAALARDEVAFRLHARDLLGTQPGLYEDWAIDYSRKCFEPVFESPFMMTRDYVRGLVTGMQTMKRDVMFKKGANFVPLPPGMLFMNRLQFGFYSVLARLEVREQQERLLLAAAGEARDEVTAPWRTLDDLRGNTGRGEALRDRPQDGGLTAMAGVDPQHRVEDLARFVLEPALGSHRESRGGEDQRNANHLHRETIAQPASSGNQINTTASHTRCATSGATRPRVLARNVLHTRPQPTPAININGERSGSSAIAYASAAQSTPSRVPRRSLSAVCITCRHTTSSPRMIGVNATALKPADGARNAE